MSVAFDEVPMGEQRALLARLLREKAAARPTTFPLSFPQQRFWFLYQLDPESSAYNSPMSVRLLGPLRFPALGRSFNEVVRRHGSLRTTFLEVDGEGMQQVAPFQPLRLPLVDLSGLAGEGRGRELGRLAAADVQRPFDLAAGPLFRIRIVRLAAGEHVALLTFHHIVFDGWSRGVLLNEIAAFYEAFAAGEPPRFPEPPIQYVDFAHWQRRQGDRLESQLGYWRRQLAPPLPVLELPFDRPPGRTGRYRSGTEWLYLPRPAVDALAALAERQGATLFMLILAAYMNWLGRHTGQADLLVGTPIANRTRKEVEGLIGLFINSLALRADLAGDPPFAAFLAQVRRTALDAYANQDVPFERVVKEIQPERDLSRGLLFQTMCVLLNAPVRELRLSDLRMVPLELDSGTAKFDLNLFFWQTENGLRGGLEYNAQLFERSTVSRMLRHLDTLLQGVVAAPEARLSQLPFLAPGERAQLLTEWNDTSVSYPSNLGLHQLFERQMERTPEQPAVRFEGVTLSYRELEERSNRLAHHLANLGVGPEQLIGVLLERSLELVVTLVAVLKAGGAYLPLDPSHPPERLAYFVSDAAPRAVVTVDRWVPMLPDSCPTVVLDRDSARLEDQPTGRLSGRVFSEQLAYVIYTSGSTGRPKGTINAHRGIVNRILWMQQAYGLSNADRVLQKTPFSFDVSVWEFFWPLAVGACLVVARPEGHRDPSYLVSVIVEEAVTTMHFVPSMLRTFVEAEGLERCRSLRRVMASGEALPTDLVEPLLSRLPGAELHNLYGPTEAAVDVTSWACTRPESEEMPRAGVPIGRPIANLRIHLLDAAGQPVPIGVGGELYIGGAGVGRGYLRRPDLTAERFVPDGFGGPGGRLYRTGDVARHLQNGAVEFLGRLDHQVKIRGFRIELEEVEAVLSQHPAVAQAVVLAERRGGETSRLSAYLVRAAASADGEAEAIREDRGDRVAQWRSVFDRTYGNGGGDGGDRADVSFNLRGWDSSYTGEPIPAPEMREWLDDTVANIRSLRPRRVLEIGFGTGMLLFRIAPGCEVYWGTDISAEAVRFVNQGLAALGYGENRVRLFQSAADDLPPFEPGTFDTVIVNSVAQYFPNVQYLIDVIAAAAEAVRPGGAIFLGDLRSLPLWEAFQTSVELFKADPALPLESLRQRIAVRRLQERELLIDPALFSALRQRLPRIGSVQVFPKRGRAHNELTAFRYQVILGVGPAPVPDVRVPWVGWQEEGLDLARLRERLATEAPPCLCLAGVPNARVERAAAAVQALAQGGSDTAGELRRRLAGSETVAVDPEDLWALGADLGYDVEMGWSRPGPEGRLEVVLRRRDHPGARRAAPVQPAVEVLPWAAYVNDPLRAARPASSEALRAFVQEKLPEYMVPASFFWLEELPLTPHGKVDRRRLLELQAVAAEREGEGAAPAGPVEELIAGIWRQVLGIEDVRRNDNFFALGGDSILSIQVTSLARRAGLAISPRLMFQHQTVSGLAAVVKKAEERPAERAAAGTISLTPIQRWFLAEESVDLHHSNQAVLLATGGVFRPGPLDAAFRQVTRHHDALRIRFQPSGSGWIQGLVPFEDGPLAVVDLSALAGQRFAGTVEAVARQVQASLDLTAGPLQRLVLLDRKEESRLLWVIHQLVADGASWRILLEDLWTAYEQLCLHQPVRLPNTATSFKAWADHLAGQDVARLAARELGTWTAQPWSEVRHLPRDTTAAGFGLVGSAGSMTVSLGREETAALLQQVPRAYRTRIDDALLAALALGYRAWSGADVLLVDVEGHGRDEAAFAGAELFRAVGWFISLFPVVLDLRGSTDPGRALCAVKEHLRGLPAGGLHFGLLRYGDGAAPELAALPRAEVRFNYLGQIDALFREHAELRRAPESVGPSRSPRAPRRHLHEWNGAVAGGRLELTCSYSREAHSPDTMERLAQGVLAELRQLAAHCHTAFGYTPSDFPLARLGQADLDRLLPALGRDREILEDLYELSPLQEGMLFHALLQPAEGVYCQQLCCRLDGPLDPDALRQAWHRTVESNPVLRTDFLWAEGGKTLQRVHRRVEVPWQVRDWRGLARHEQRQRLDVFLEEDRLLGFDPARAPLLRLHLLRVGETSWYFAWLYHHILLDGWSLPLLLREVFERYAAAVQGHAPWSALRRPYRDYIAWLLQQETAGAEELWRREMAGFPAPTPLPGDRGPAGPGGLGERRLLMPAADTAALGGYARAHGLTVNTLLLGAWAVLLARWSGERDVVFGTTVAGRPAELEGAESMIGLFINTLPVRARVEPAAPQLEWLARLQAWSSAAREIEHIPLPRIQGWSEVSRGTPLFDSLVVFENYPVDQALSQLDLGVEIGEVRLVERTNYSLSLRSNPDRELVLSLAYDDARFDAADMERILRHLRTLLAGWAGGEGRRLFELPLLSAAERSQLLREWNDTAAFVTGDDVAGLFAAQAARRPDAVAAADEERAVTYRELDRLATAVGRRLAGRGVGREVVVAVLAPRNVEFLAAMLGIWKAGAVFLPLDPQHPAERHRRILAQSRSRVLLAARELAPAVAAMALPGAGQGSLLWLEDTLAGGALPERELPGALAGNLAYVIYTSGSTGTPKGAMVTQRGMLNHLWAKVEQLALGPADVIAQSASQCFDISIWQFLAALLAGGRTRIYSEEVVHDPGLILEGTARDGVTIYETVPTLLRALLAEPGLAQAFPALRWMIPTGEALPPDLCRTWREAFPAVPLLNAYGPTECSDDVTHHRVDPLAALAPTAERQVPIGRPVLNTQLYVLDRDLAPMPRGGMGEIWIGGRGVGRGYLNDAWRTAQAFRPDPFAGEPGSRMYRSGDLGRWRASAVLEFFGRNDQQVKIRGFRIELGEIESALSALDEIRQAVVLAADGRLVAYLVLEPTAQGLDLQEVRRQIGRSLPESMVPTGWAVLEALPLLASGKVDRGALPHPDQMALPVAAAAAPRNPVEEQLLAIWCEVLRVDGIGVHDNFFAVGGDSILSIQVSSRARGAGLAVSPRLLFQHPTVAELARAVGEAAGSAAPAETAAALGRVPLTPAQRFFLDGPDGDPIDPQHFNQAVLLETTERLAPALLEAALARLAGHHEALRHRFQRHASGWEQTALPAEAAAPAVVGRVDLSRLPDERLRGALDEVVAAAQASLDLAAGPLQRMVLLDRGSHRSGRLLWVIHHLVVDGVSWRILLDDLLAAYGSLEAGWAPRLPARTTPFQAWAERLRERGRAPAAAADVRLWRDQPWGEVRPLPRDLSESRSEGRSEDRPAGEAENLVGGERLATLELDAEETRLLLQRSHRAYNTRVDDLLLASLALALRRFAAVPVLLVDMEGHGRAEVFDDVDLARTVGWFTTIFPVVLDLGSASGGDGALKAVKETLRRIPDGGLGFGVLRYLSGLGGELSALPRAEVAFNYLGQLDQALPRGARLAPAPEPVGHARSRRGLRPYLMEWDAWVVHGRLHLGCRYGARIHRRETVERLLADVAGELRALIAYCCTDGPRGWTPSDFPAARLGQDELDGLAPLLLEQRSPAGGRIEDLSELSPMQEGVLFHALYAPGEGIYIEQLAYELRGALDVGVLRQAWDLVVRRHTALRTDFLLHQAEKPLQRVWSDVDVPWRSEDWRHLAAGAQHDELAAFLRQDRRRDFDLQGAPLVRLALLRLGEKRHQFVCSFHQVMMDGWCLPILFREVFTCYESLARGDRPTLPPARPFRDYIRWLQAQDREEAQAFWSRELAGIVAPTPLPGDLGGAGARPAMTFRESLLSAAATEALTAFSRRCRTTLNTVLQAAWSLLLARGAGEDDVLFGMTVAGRPPELPGSGSMIGLFINTLPMRVRVAEQEPVGDWLEQIQERQSAARQFESTPLVQVQGWSEVPRGRPLFESLVLFENFPVDETLRQGTGSVGIGEVELYEFNNFPLTLTVVPRPHLILRLSFDAHRFAGAGMARLLGQLETVLLGMAANPGRRVGDLGLLTPAERHQLLAEWNDQRRQPDVRGFTRRFEEQARRSPEAPAAACEDRVLTYRELSAHAGCWAGFLRGQGVGPDSLVAVLAERNLDFLALLVGVWQAGGAYLPLDPLHSTERYRKILERAQPAVVIAGPRWFEAARALSASSSRPWSIHELAQPAGRAHGGRPAAEEEAGAALAYVIYTSGSTGEPKGVMVEQRGMVNHLDAKIHALGLTAADRVAQTASQCFDISVWQLMSPLLVGGEVRIYPDEVAHDPTAFLAHLRQDRVTVAEAVPSLLRAVLEAGEPPALPDLRWMLLTGEALPPDLCRAWAGHYPDIPLLNAYGPTECSDDVSHHVLRSADPIGALSVPIGRPVDNTRLYLLDRVLRPMAAGVTGEIWVGGRGVGRGYLQDPSRTAEVFLPDPFAEEPGARMYRTGDLGRHVQAGALEYLGRIDQQVKVRGFRIELGEIEAWMNRCPGVSAAVARLEERRLQDGPLDRAIVAFVEMAGGRTLDGDALRAFLRAELPEYMVPSAFVQLDALPLNANGKIDRGALRRIEVPAAAAGAPDDYVAPRNDVEEAVAEVFCKVLRRERVSVHHDFFHLGGHSLLATQAVVRLRQALQIDLPLPVFFENPTIAGLAVRIEEIVVEELEKLDEVEAETRRVTQNQRG